MSSWRDVAALALAREAAGGPPAHATVNGVPVWLDNDVRRLRGLPPPRLTDPRAWSPVVADALRLLNDGWTAKALALGWHPLELYGIGRRDSAEFHGVAIWLRTRRLIMLDETIAVVADAGGRAYFTRGKHFREGGGDDPALCYLWQFGR